MIKYDPFLTFSKAVAEVLQLFGASKPKEIRNYLIQSGGWHNPRINIINKVLTQYLVGQVKLREDGRWELTQPIEILTPLFRKPSPIKEKNMRAKPHILFVCGKNKWRSPTAERIYKNDKRIEVRSAGMSGKSKHPISNDDVEWADIILVMESGYKSWILGLFRDLSLPKIENLDIPDEYEYMDEELIELIQKRVEYYIEKLEKQASLP
jgi:protein-tyrosine phosphatase